MEITLVAALLGSGPDDVGRVGRDAGHQAARGRTDWLQDLLIEVNRTDGGGDPWFTGYREALLDIIGGLLSETASRAQDDDVVEQVTRAPIRQAVVRALDGVVRTPKELGAQIGKKVEQVSRGLRELQDLGVVEVLSSDADKRKRPVRLTLRGRAIVKELSQAPLTADLKLGIELAAEYHAALIAGGRLFRDEYLGWASKKVSGELAEAVWLAVTDAAAARFVVTERHGTAYLVPDASEQALRSELSAKWLAAWAQRQHQKRGVEVVFVRTDVDRDDWTHVLRDANERCTSVQLRHIRSVDLRLADTLPDAARPYDILYTHPFTHAREPASVDPVVRNASYIWVLREGDRPVEATRSTNVPHLHPLDFAKEVAA